MLNLDNVTYQKRREPSRPIHNTSEEGRSLENDLQQMCDLIDRAMGNTNQRITNEIKINAILQKVADQFGFNNWYEVRDYLNRRFV